MERFLDSRKAAKFGLLTLIAVGGSAIYGDAARLALPTSNVPVGAALITLSTGCSWLVLGALLRGFTRKPLIVLAEICLVTMAYGEAILVPGAFLNWANSVHLDPVLLNLAIILVANVVMAWVFVGQLSRIGVREKLSASLWLLGLNGSWVVFLFVFVRILHGGR